MQFNGGDGVVSTTIEQALAVWIVSSGEYFSSFACRHQPTTTEITTESVRMIHS
jgi:hypothetical protein